MSLYQVVRIVLGVALSGVIGWISLLAFNALKIWQQFEAFEAAGSRGADLGMAPSAIEKAINTMQGGSAVYVGATGALTALFAAVFWREGGPLGAAPAASALAMAGFVAGGIYWMIASPSNSRG